MPIKKALLILLLLAVVGFVFVFTVYYYKTVLSEDLYKKGNYNNIKQNEISNTERANYSTTTKNTIATTSIHEINTEQQADEVINKIEATTENQSNGFKSQEEFDNARSRMLEYMNKK